MTPPDPAPLDAAKRRLVYRLQAAARKSPDYTVAGAPACVWLDDIDNLIVAALATPPLDVERLIGYLWIATGKNRVALPELRRRDCRHRRRVHPSHRGRP